MGGVASAIGNVVGSIAGGISSGAGLGNSYQAQAPEIEKQKDLIAQIQAAQGGMGGVQNQQQALAQALLAQSQGQGPNPAALMMQQAQDRANMQNAGMLASAKGISPALAARMAAQNAQAGNQSIAQQTGILGAQQQLSAQQQLGGLYGQMGGQNINQQQLLQQALANQNQLGVQGNLGAQQINAGVAQGNAQTQGQIVGGLLSGAGALAGSALSKADGGFIPGKAKVPGDHPANDTVPALLSPGEIVVPRSHADDPESAKAFIDYLMKNKGKKGAK